MTDGFTHDDLKAYGDVGHKIYLTLIDGGPGLDETGMDPDDAAVKTRRLMELLADEGLPAVDREALIETIERTLARHSGRPLAWQAEHLADVLHTTGTLRDADEVRREAEHHVPEQCSDSRCPVCICVAGYEARNHKAEDGAGEESLDADDKLTATREALAERLANAGPYTHPWRGTPYAMSVAADWVNAAIEDGVLVDAEQSDLRAAIETLCEERLTSATGVNKRLRALVADEGADALREHDAKVWEDLHDQFCLSVICTAHRNPYNTDSKEDGDE